MDTYKKFIYLLWICELFECQVNVTNLNGNFLCGYSTKLECAIPGFGGEMTWKLDGTIVAQCAFDSCTALGALPPGDVFTPNETAKMFNLDISVTHADNGTQYQCDDGAYQDQTTVSIQVPPSESAFTTEITETATSIIVEAGCFYPTDAGRMNVYCVSGDTEIKVKETLPMIPTTTGCTGDCAGPNIYTAVGSYPIDSSNTRGNSKYRFQVYHKDFKQYAIAIDTTTIYNCNTVSYYNRFSTITPVDPDVIEGSNITFVCTMSSPVYYVTWKLAVNASTSYTSYMRLQNGTCAIVTSYLSDITKYSYACTSTVYQVIIKNVQRSQHNAELSCSPIGNPYGKTSTIHVQVPVSSVSITPSLTTVDVIENTVKEFTCQTSASRPDSTVTWYKVESGRTSQINQNITSSNTNDDFSITTSTLKFVPSRQQDGVQIFCKAENTVNTSPAQSGRRTLNVLYEERPVIREGNVYRVIENNQGQLSCSVSGGNPTPTLSWNCSVLSPTELDSSNNGIITKTLTWTAVLGSDISCSCTSQQTGFSNRVVNVFVSVLYPPSPPQFYVNGNIINGDISFIAGKSRSIQCVSDSKPSPSSYNWTGPKTNNGQNMTFNAVQKGHNGQYTCEVKNIMNSTTGGYIHGSNSSSVNLVVLYPPSMLSLYFGSLSGTLISKKSINVVKGDTINIGCKSNDGEPEPTIRWSGQNRDDPLLTVQQVQESLTSKTCTATNIMRVTGGNEENGVVSDTINFNVSVPPNISGCTFYYTNNPINVIQITGTLMLREHESFTLECSSAGKPSPNISWIIPSSPTATTKSVTINEVTRDKRGNYVFYASSTLRPSYQSPRDITVDKSITVEVLFPPIVTDMTNISQLVGTRLEFDCPYTVGFPTDTTFKWSRNVDSQTWSTRKLSIPNVKKEDAGNYQCHVSNTMKPSGDSQSCTGSDVKTFYFNVLYKASIISFVIDGFTENVVTVNENYSTSFVCNVDSNPSAVITLTNYTGIVKSVTSEKLEHTIKATCLDAGTYNCSARNKHNGEDVPIRTIRLFVNCRPRSAEEVIQKRTSEKGKTSTITFNAIAYPVPTFVWWKFVEGTWTKLKSDDNHVIQSSDLQTNLTINKLVLEDFITYKLVAENTIGKIEQTYVLEQYDIPDPPKDIRHVEALTTASSIYISWKPGNNGGLPQTFHIKYKKGLTSTWNYIDVIDTGDKIMSYSITGLAEKTQYAIIMYSSNKKGNSTESDVYTALTNENAHSETYNIAPIIGYSVGATSGFFIMVSFSICLLRRFLSRGSKNVDKTVSPSDAQQPNVMSTLAAAYQSEGGVYNYDSLELANRDESNYSDLDTWASDQDQEKVVYENMKLE